MIPVNEHWKRALFRNARWVPELFACWNALCLNVKLNWIHKYSLFQLSFMRTINSSLLCHKYRANALSLMKKDNQITRSYIYDDCFRVWALNCDYFLVNISLASIVTYQCEQISWTSFRSSTGFLLKRVCSCRLHYKINLKGIWQPKCYLFIVNRPYMILWILWVCSGCIGSIIIVVVISLVFSFY